MMMKVYKYIMVGALALILFSCKKYADPSSEDLGYSYFPINEGEYYVYSVTDTAFEGVNNKVIKNYKVKEEIHEAITVNDEVRYQVYLYYRNEGEAWKSYPDSVWTEFNTLQKIIRVQNNVRFVPLVFPLELGKQWDGNISDPTSDPQKYYSIVSVRRPFSFDNTNYTETVKVQLLKDKSVINDHDSYEIYAEGTGLVYKKEKIYDFQEGGTLYTVPVKGHHLVKKLIGHGRYK